MQHQHFPTPEIQRGWIVQIKSAKIGKENESDIAEESTNSLSSVETSPGRGETPLFDGPTSLETAELHHAPEGLIETNVGDYTGIENFNDLKNVFVQESNKIWTIATPIAFNIMCNYAINTFTNIFVGHIGDLELSAIAISLSVISNLSFGFLVSFYELLRSFIMYTTL